MAARKINLLLVDDQPNNLIALEAVLKGPEYHLIFANSGMEAIELLKVHDDIGVVLLDVQMPEMDGFQTARQIKLLPQHKDTPIIFITAIYKEDPFIKKGYQAGAVDYFGKPFDPEILKLKVGLYSAFQQKNQLITEREKRIQATEELMSAGRKLEAMLAKLPVGVLITDDSGRVFQVNEELTKILGFQEQIAADAYGEFFGWWDKEGKLLKAADGPLFRAVQNGESAHNEVAVLKCFDGQSKSALISASPLRAMNGKIVGAVVVLQDITEHQRIRADVESQIQKLASLGH